MILMRCGILYVAIPGYLPCPLHYDFYRITSKVSEKYNEYELNPLLYHHQYALNEQAL